MPESPRLSDRPEKLSGYMKFVKETRRWYFTKADGEIVGEAFVVGVTRIKPGAPGGWISSERYSFHVKVGDTWYSGRGYGDTMSINLRRMKTKPRTGYGR